MPGHPLDSQEPNGAMKASSLERHVTAGGSGGVRMTKGFTIFCKRSWCCVSVRVRIFERSGSGGTCLFTVEMRRLPRKG